MHVSAHEVGNRGIYQPMALELGTAAKRRAHEMHPKVTALARTGMSGVRGAVVTDVERQRRKLLLESRAQPCDAFGAHARCTAAPLRRESQRICAPTKTKFASVKPMTLKLTQARSLALNATARFKKPRKI